MTKQKNIIVINGKAYDAITGDIVEHNAAEEGLVSDFVDPPETAQAHSTSHKKVHHRKTQHLAHHKPQKSITLKRVQPKKSKALASAKSMPINNDGTITIEADGTFYNNRDRHERAKKISKSSAISRFNFSFEPAISKSHQPIDVQPAPPAPVLMTPVPKLNSPTTSQDLFNEALKKADSHKQKNHKVHRKHRLAKKLGVSNKAANALTVVVFMVVLGGFIAYQNAANISMRVAASQSGLSSATLPGYKPSGFSLNRQVNSSPGQVVLSYHSNSDDRYFTVTQAGSSWNSQTLADSFLEGKESQRIAQSNGKTVYIYEGANATWVDGGIWYRVEGNSLLNTDQLLKLANSF